MLIKENSICTYVFKWGMYNIHDYISFGENIVFPGVLIACVLTRDNGTHPSQAIYSVIPICDM